MPDVISEYQKWKAQGENLKSQAKQAIETRFRELLTEAVTIAEEYRADFGAPLKPPPSGQTKSTSVAPGGSDTGFPGCQPLVSVSGRRSKHALLPACGDPPQGGIIS